MALVLRGDHELNEVKAAKLPQVAKPLVFLTPGEVELASGCEAGSIGPVGLKITVIADGSAARVADFVCGANVNGKHLINVNWGRDFCPRRSVPTCAKVIEGDPCPDSGKGNCSGKLSIRRGIEVGHIFQLGTKYSEAMNATCLDETGKSVVMPMGCYGIGVSRVVAAAIEQNHDTNGIIWPDAIAPFHVALVPIGLSQIHHRARSRGQTLRRPDLHRSRRAARRPRRTPGRDVRRPRPRRYPAPPGAGRQGAGESMVGYKGRRDKTPREFRWTTPSPRFAQ